MKKLIGILLLLALTTNCASMRRHPVIWGVTTGAAISLVVVVATHKSCPPVINGVPYDGTPPCPKYWPDTDGPGKK
jgi:hypothetical protein